VEQRVLQKRGFYLGAKALIALLAHHPSGKHLLFIAYTLRHDVAYIKEHINIRPLGATPKAAPRDSQGWHVSSFLLLARS
jgi:hypothetical protein